MKPPLVMIVMVVVMERRLKEGGRGGEREALYVAGK